ncbi:MAG: bifunctional indole-3-glycerol-phosphate synthase TrpC/phosphoribosylanthranilate isomerase TrpF [Enterobacteriaceae bacterium]
MKQETILNKIVRDKALWLQQRKQEQPLETFYQQLQPAQRSFYQTLQQKKTHFILECKKASPSKGLLRPDFDPAAIARIYGRYASVISVLTDEAYFQGDFAFLPLVSAQVTQPVLCKDFMIDPYQIYLARHYQADAILLMLSVLDDEQYRHLAQVAHSLNMGVLTEVSNEQELERAIALQAKVVGINNRDLRDLSIDLQRTRQLAPRLGKEVVVISESGISNNGQVRDLSQYANGFLIGSSLMAQADLELAVRQIILGDNKVCGLTRTEDAAMVYQSGAVYGGLIFAPRSSRYIDPEQARAVMLSAPLRWVGVFVDESVEQVCAIASQLGLYAVQLHGNEDARYIAQLREQLPAQCQIWRAVCIKESVPALDLPGVDRYLLDAASGGSGKTFDWQLLQGLPLNTLQLAGGINADNVLQAVQLGCLGLDINSGVESQPGIKDHQRLQEIFNLLSSYTHRLSS